MLATATSPNFSPVWLGNPAAQGLKQPPLFTQPRHPTSITVKVTQMGLIGRGSDGCRNTVGGGTRMV